MALKMRYLAITLLLAILFLGVTHGKNLYIGGIDQDQQAISDNTKFATQIDAKYASTYTGSTIDNANEVRYAALDKPTDQNGLNLPELNSQSPGTSLHYGTIVAYSGGTASAITALDPQSKHGVTCDTLILISPMAAGVPDWYLVGTMAAASGAGTMTAATAAVITGPAAPVTTPIGFGIGAYLMSVASTPLAAQLARDNYGAQINRILNAEPPIVKNIVVIQSDEDKLLSPFDFLFQARFTEGANPRITVHTIDLESTDGTKAHKELFDYAKNHLELKDGKVHYSSQPISQKTSSAFPKNPWGTGSPLLPPPEWSMLSDEGPSGSSVSDIGTMTAQGDSGASDTTTDQSQPVTPSTPTTPPEDITPPTITPPEGFHLENDGNYYLDEDGDLYRWNPTNQEIWFSQPLIHPNTWYLNGYWDGTSFTWTPIDWDAGVAGVGTLV